MTRIEEAQKFAHEAHDSINQKRKYTGEPYWVHTDEVASIVAATPGATEDMVIAAHLHDVLEDVTTVNPRFYNRITIITHFGAEVCYMVDDLTDVYIKEAYPKLNRVERKRKERERIRLIRITSKTIKLADLISNTKSIVADDPDFARVYLREKLALLPYLADGSPLLLQRASDAAIAGYEKLGLDLPVINS